MAVNRMLLKTSLCLLLSQAGHSTERTEEILDVSSMKLYVEEQGSIAHEVYEKLFSEGALSPIKQRAELFPMLDRKCYTDTVLKGSRQVSTDFLDVYLNCDFNQSILTSYPLYFKEDKTPNARVGVFLWYLHDNGEPYLLFSQNPYTADNPHKSESYNDLGGSMQLKQGMPETFLETAQRVINKQTGHLYNLEPEMIIKNSFIYFRHSLNDRQISILFTQAPYYSPTELKEAVAEAESSSSVKPNFLWISVKSILSTLPFVIEHLKSLQSQVGKPSYIDTAFKWENLESLDGETISLRVRAFIPEVFKDEETQKILHHLTSRNDREHHKAS